MVLRMGAGSEGEWVIIVVILSFGLLLCHVLKKRRLLLVKLQKVIHHRAGLILLSNWLVEPQRGQTVALN